MSDTCSVNHATLVPYSDDALAVLAEHIVRNECLPDLSRVVVLMPETLAADRLREILLGRAHACGYSALLGPKIDTLRCWVETNVPSRSRIIGNAGRRLLLVESLLHYPAIFGASDPWRLAECLLELFDELTLRQVDLSDDLEQFTARLAEAYGIRQTRVAALSREAHIVHTLWRGWREQLHAEDWLDPPAAYVRKLEDSGGIDRALRFYLIGYLDLLPMELAWSHALQARGQLSVIIQGELNSRVKSPDCHPDVPIQNLLARFPSHVTTTTASDSVATFTQFITAAYTLDETPLALQARQFATENPVSPAAARLSIHAAPSAEFEALAIDIQVRRWLIEGRDSIGIVVEDRRLARRVRALLERADVRIQDASGWALSTTSAATAVESWLQCVEEDFAYLPLLDMLKSPFIFPERDRDAHLATVYRLEQDLVLHEKIYRGLDRYRRHLQYRSRRLPEGYAESQAALTSLFDELEQAARPLVAFIGQRKHSPARMLNALRSGLQALGMESALIADAAGLRVIEQLDGMQRALEGRTLTMTWTEFRAWLGRSLEQANFCPDAGSGAVRMLGLEQTALLGFDALIIAGANRDHLPGAASTTPFFNSAVRRELGLTTSQDRTATRFYHFRRLLECAPQVLITLRRQQNGEDMLPSLWVEALQVLHELAYWDRLENAELAHLVQHADTAVLRCDTSTLPSSGAYPRPRIDRRFMPTTLSASAHQDLMDCPYRFFAAHCLGLTAIEPIREALAKSDYGQRVHRILEAFHQGAPGFPGPFSESLTAATRAEAMQLLEQISRSVFARDLEDNFVHRGWLKRWLATLPEYLDWQIERSREWSVMACEARVRRGGVLPALELKGRLDRIDVKADSIAIIDYKTGAAPNIANITEGEAVQLAFYALLAEEWNETSLPVERVEYLLLDAGKVASGACLEGEALQRCKNKLRERLRIMVEQMEQGAVLPAWGDTTSCGWCAMSGLCRKQAWS